MKPLPLYKCWVFDCDGVLLDSNRVKSDAFYETALPFGEAAAAALLAYHQEHGGVSRFLKFEHLFANILKLSEFQQDLEDALARFAKISREGILKAPEAPGLRDLLGALRQRGARNFVVSGGMQDELRDVFRARGLDQYFETIFGSPDNKDEILTRELAKGTITSPAVFIGDSRYDYEAASHHGIDFIFASDWSEFDGWQSFFADKPIRIVSSIGDLLEGDGPAFAS